ncbi:MAG: CDP-archaeol synthase [Chromatiaceae bacterium]|jgi:CDP-2,3-bis-(O-geranylgeranyl)-sn-glycerol synthase|nr:CDP-archaeol synthase [Chromatiaceae bacterium]
MPDLLVLLILLIAANAAPILADDLLGGRWSWPLDGGLRLGDGRRLLGSSATWRGVIAAVAVTAALAALFGHGIATGALVGLLAMLGDAASSFVKRRLRLEPGDPAFGLDQIPESLLPVLVIAGDYGLAWLDVALLVAAFTLFDLLVSRILYRFRLRKRPY